MSFDSVDCWLSKVILKPNAVEDGSEQPLMEDKAPIFSALPHIATEAIIPKF
jgi:hypothetical protein